MAAIDAAGTFGDPVFLDAILAVAGDGANWGVVGSAVRALRNLKFDHATHVLVTHMQNTTVPRNKRREARSHTYNTCGDERRVWMHSRWRV
mmetsp:Transcript_43022/g.108662  ORF Transcript_43022/g.108662 Transcript_43022/m.108662 type:complete len:91 (+) Transcript_43022:396-668(+)